MKKQNSNTDSSILSIPPRGSVVALGNHPTQKVEYSEKYYDADFEYRHVILPRHMVDQIKGKSILTEQEWRQLGVTQSRGWEHYEIHKHEPHILIFRRLIGTDPKTGMVNSSLRNEHFQSQERKFDCIMASILTSE